MIAVAECGPTWRFGRHREVGKIPVLLAQNLWTGWGNHWGSQRFVDRCL
jgi:hypothetical protein